MSAITIMAAALEAELARRNIVGLDLTPVLADECKDILRTVIDRAVALAATYETSHPGPLSHPSGRALDGGHIAPGDAPAVPSGEKPSWTAYLDGAGEP